MALHYLCCTQRNHISGQASGVPARPLRYGVGGDLRNCGRFQPFASQKCWQAQGMGVWGAKSLRLWRFFGGALASLLRANSTESHGEEALWDCDNTPPHWGGASTPTDEEGGTGKEVCTVYRLQTMAGGVYALIYPSWPLPSAALRSPTLYPTP